MPGLKTETLHTNLAKDIDIGFDRAFIEKWIRYQKYPWMLIGLFIAAGLSGILGRGPLAKGIATSGPGGVEVRYERIARNKTPAVIEIRVPRANISGDTLRMRLEGDLVNRAKLQRIIPQPQRAEPLADGLIVEFPATPATPEQRILISQEPGSPGKLWNRVAVENGPHVEFNQIILP